VAQLFLVRDHVVVGNARLASGYGIYRACRCGLASSEHLVDFFPLEHGIPDEQAYASHHDGHDQNGK
jgi:hypothetical protein